MAFNPLYNDNRRKGPDTLIKICRLLAFSGWVLIIIFLLIIGYAKPAFETFFERYKGFHFNDDWDLDLLRYGFYLMLAVLCLSILGIIMNSFRHRRRKDEYLVSLFLMGLTALIGIAIYLFSFPDTLSFF